MGKRHRRAHKSGRESAPNQHYENLVRLREQNPQAYERLGDATHQTIEQYELGRLAQTFEQHPGNESLLELSRRLPKVFARLSQTTRDEVDRYAARRRAFVIVNEEETQKDQTP